MISLEDKEMDKLKKELEVLKSWGIESIPVDKVLSMIEREEVTFRFPLGGQSTVISSAIVDVSPVGGIIFYIDDTADGIYEFFDADGNLMKDIKVGDRPCTYRIIAKGTKDKYYVYYDEMYTSKRWTYYKDRAYVYDTISSLGLEIGSGKTNTATMMARDNGAYVTADSDGYPTIWYQLQQTRLAKASGCDDWFIPSKNEIELLRIAIESRIITGGTIAGSSYEESVFNDSYVWSSSEYSSQNAWSWSYGSQNWYNYSKGIYDSVFLVRAF